MICNVKSRILYIVYTTQTDDHRGSQHRGPPKGDQYHFIISDYRVRFRKIYLPIIRHPRRHGNENYSPVLRQGDRVIGMMDPKRGIAPYLWHYDSFDL
ncbi:hypothetical protein CDAR_13881 [Caerostris darwini]|uniref:Uncharacterized protein n=1 Tax=Caerostris darwini TaxID=1538125 RepID=A0AAV4VY70_9ARAC|nr:hypothetical protein CDAR_13881 [Caerostris darwini]